MAELENPQQYLSGQSLARDRGTTAKKVVFEIEDWKLRTNVVDYRNYDVRRELDPSSIPSLYELFNNEQDIDRLVRRTLRDAQTKIKDFQTFKRAFEEAWSINPKEPRRARNLFGKLSGQEDLLMELFTQPEIQAEVTKNGEADGAKALKKELAHIRPLSEREARQLWRQKRRHEVQLISRGFIPITQYQKTGALPKLERSPKKKMGYTIAQKTGRRGTIYRRTKPKSFNKAQERFLMNNPRVPASKLTAQFNILFDTNRTQQSIYYKRYRLLQDESK